MSKAFTRESDAESSDDDDELPEPRLPTGAKNYITPAGYRRLMDELKELAVTIRPEVARVVSWAAENGDRSENGDYIYGKKRLREIDRRMRFLTKRLRAAEVVDPTERDVPGVFFGATVTVEDEEGEQRTYAIVGVDEIDLERGRISWISPMANALMKHREGDVVTLRTPGGLREIEILGVVYQPLD